MLVGRAHLEDIQQILPIPLQILEGQRHLIRLQVAGDERLDAGLVDDGRAGRVKFLVARVLGIPQQEDHLACFARLQGQPQVVRPDRRPAVRNRVGGAAARHRQRILEAAVGPQKGLALRVVAGQGL